MLAWCYKWLPIVFGCHCRDDRSFHWKGRKFPLCARCTGELAGLILGFVTFFFFRMSLAAYLLLMVPMVADGFCQLLTRYESTNGRRLVSGILFGYGLYGVFLRSTILTFQWGYRFAS